jgi:hypothetical protein
MPGWSGDNQSIAKDLAEYTVAHFNIGEPAEQVRPKVDALLKRRGLTGIKAVDAVAAAIAYTAKLGPLEQEDQGPEQAEQAERVYAQLGLPTTVDDLNAVLAAREFLVQLEAELRAG